MSSLHFPGATDPVAPAIARQAVQWWIELRSSEFDSARRALWERWRAADPAHEAAWQRIESVGGRLAEIPSPLARAALTAAPESMQRRRGMQLLTALVVGGGGALVATQSTAWHAWNADHVAAVGERPALALPDGGRVVLNSGSAVNVRFDAERRVLQLVRGEILVQTAPDARQRPFLVQTGAGSVRAIGTRFTVRLRDDAAVDVGVLQGAVELRPVDAPAALRVLQAGEAGRFTRARTGNATPLDADASAWADGMLVVSHMRLDDFLAELGRHRQGRLGCDPAIAGLQVSGAYPLADTDRVLAALTSALPVEVHTYTRFWVSVKPRRARG
ncbi:MULTISPECIES: FecR domain-containing protein [unclassified Variovorax]|uniref:FecR domain-containing protein n=1 Tax=unclassified Variovorax TaxID=663243 RepID=UPI002578BF2E|nr:MULTISPECIES: FecR domain-containing protein [unclassified Variovorax]MDM0087738.1 FecR domain-containing protein [Variovorax sp. J22G40]MDM0144005.1 FecR domain-containing protein [Variovorax sp. J2P1-31]